jgi:hypothetical protein
MVILIIKYQNLTINRPKPIYFTRYQPLWVLSWRISRRDKSWGCLIHRGSILELERESKSIWTIVVWLLTSWLEIISSPEFDKKLSKFSTRSSNKFWWRAMDAWFFVVSIRWLWSFSKTFAMQTNNQRRRLTLSWWFWGSSSILSVLSSIASTWHASCQCLMTDNLTIRLPTVRFGALNEKPDSTVNAGQRFRRV